ncbi:response regulator [Streptomyces mirabilis]|uniref:response regulator n=1 Tax=Streptomyces mirabilis TaxID=68239 RepID=UPI002B1CCE57|nr:response regulator [Streptomyces mirabilis]
MVVDGQSDLTVVGEAGDGETAVAQALTLRPDLVLMDVRLPHLDGISAGLGLRRPAPARLNRPSPLTAGLLRPASAAWPSTWAASTPAAAAHRTGLRLHHRRRHLPRPRARHQPPPSWPG